MVPALLRYGPNCQKSQHGSPSSSPLSCGGNNPSPYIVDHEVAEPTGLAPGTVVIATTWSTGIVVGICKNWTSACDVNPQPLFLLPHQNEWSNFTNISGQDVWQGWGYEDRTCIS
eukprot:SAG31_NODE_16112_length_722_cov_1.149278_2_plen_114_part_01